MLVRLAFRNLWRHARRTGITASAIVIGVAFMMLSINLGNGQHNSMIRTGVSQLAGHVVVQAPGYQEERDQDLFVENATPVAEALDKAFPEASVTRRAFLGGLLNSTTNSVGVLLTAVDPGPEAAVTDWDDKLVAGEYLSGESDREIVIGRTLAETLEVELGDKIVFMTQGSEEVESRLFRVKGMISTGVDDIDGFFALADIDAVNELLGEDAAHQVAVHLPSDEGSIDALATAESVVGDSLQVLHWEQALPEIAEFVRLDDRWNFYFLFVIGVMVAVGLTNTVLMSVMERIREFGVMLAIGTSRRRLRDLILLEGALLGSLGVVAGFVLGLLVCWPLSVHGLDMAAFMGADSYDAGGVHVSSVMYAEWNWPAIAGMVVVGFILTLIACVYPAYKAGRLEPVAAMNHV